MDFGWIKNTLFHQISVRNGWWVDRKITFPIGRWTKQGVKERVIKFTFIVGVRRPFSTENGSTTSVTALANSNPRNCSLSKALELVTLSHFKLGGSMESFL
jgi:hypothetical protein